MYKNVILGLLLTSSVCVADIIIKSNDGASIAIADELVNESKTLTDLATNELLTKDDAGNVVYVSDIFTGADIKYLYKLLEFAQHHDLPTDLPKFPNFPSVQDHLKYQKDMDQISESFKQQFPDELFYKELFAIAEFFDIPVIMEIIARLLLTSDMDVSMLEAERLVDYTPRLQMVMAQQLKKRIALDNARRVESMAQWRNRLEGLEVIPHLVTNSLFYTVPIAALSYFTKNSCVIHSLGSNLALAKITQKQFKERISKPITEQASSLWYAAPIVVNALLGSMLNETNRPIGQKVMASLVLQAPAVAFALYKGLKERKIKRYRNEFENIKSELKSYIDNKMDNTMIFSSNALPQLMSNYKQIKTELGDYLFNKEKISARAFVEIALIKALLFKGLIEIVPWVRGGEADEYALRSKPNNSMQIQSILSLFTKSDDSPFYRSLYEFDPSVIKYVKQKESDANVVPPASLNTLEY